MMMNSGVGMKEESPQRLRVNTRKSKIVTVDDGKKSMDIADAFEYQKMMGQTYRQRNQRNIIKCKFLYNKLAALSKMQGVPEMIASEVSEVDVKIKNLEQSLLFKRSQQMKKLKKKVTAFLEQISFEIQPEDMDKIEDEIEIILLLMDIFEEKFYEMTAERKEIDEIVSRVQRDSEPASNVHYEEVKKQNERLLLRIATLEGEVNKLKSGQVKKISLDFSRKEDSYEPAGEEVIATKNLAIERYLKQIGDFQQQVSDLKVKLKFTEDKLDRSRREEAQWKQRYRIIQTQKNERIQLLQQSLSQRESQR